MGHVWQPAILVYVPWQEFIATYSYIHGGAWRDPAINSESFDPTLEILLGHPTINDVEGFASINYRLSPYPSHQTRPSTPGDPARNALHSDHIEDVIAALDFLQHRYSFGERYLLVGHSCGATLAFQVTMGQWHFPGTENMKMPRGVLGLEGIYDLAALRDDHKYSPVYQEFIENAFGHDEMNWKTASPTSADLSKTWPEGELAILAHSANDELVNHEQVDRMAKTLTQCETAGRQDLIQSLIGNHDDVWRGGREMAECIVIALERLTQR